jgi:ribosome-binding factor A
MPEKIDRLTRVNELLKREIASEIEKSAVTPPGMLVSVTEVVTSVDLRNATVSVSIFGGKNTSRNEIFKELNCKRTDMQKVLAKVLAFKHTPVLCFRQDFRIEQGDRVFNMLNETPGEDE